MNSSNNWSQQKFNNIVSAITNAANKMKENPGNSYVLVPESMFDSEDLPMKVSLKEVEE